MIVLICLRISESGDYCTGHSLAKWELITFSCRLRAMLGIGPPSTLGHTCTCDVPQVQVRGNERSQYRPVETQSVCPHYTVARPKLARPVSKIGLPRGL
jgi:hypothetical protein